MAASFKKLVHWGAEVSMSDISPFGSPDRTADSMISTSSLEFVNSQLIAHGFTTSPGLSIDGIPNADLEKVVKCFLNMLSQRIEDMSRMEELATKIRTLNYDYERMKSMHAVAAERALSAEKEADFQKSRLGAANRTLQASEASHKQTSAELQRTRSALQGVRATSQNELRKKEKEIERLMERWSKLADSQGKLNATPSGIYCANVEIIEGSEHLGRGEDYLEVALEQAEQTREGLQVENLSLRKTVVSIYNEAQAMLYEARLITSNNVLEPSPPATVASLFPLHPPSYAKDQLSLVLSDIQACIAELSQPQESQADPAPSPEELEKLQGVITQLQSQLDTAKQETLSQTKETRELFDRFAQDHRVTSDRAQEISIELMTVPARDAEEDRLNKLKAELDEERRSYTEAAILLGRERAALEMERMKLADDKRSWQVEQMLAELPPTPQPVGSPPRREDPPVKLPKASPKKSPVKPIVVGKAGAGRKATKLSRQAHKVPIPAYETEVIPVPVHASSISMRPIGLGTSLLATSFQLPPPSPQTSLPTSPALPPSTDISDLPPLPQPQLTGLLTVPETPHQRPFPMAKPLANRMVHAYSPAKPSPLSRVAVLAESVTSPEQAEAGPSSISAASSLPPAESCEEMFPPVEPKQMSLAAELGVESSPEEVKEKKVRQTKAAPSRKPTATTSRKIHGIDTRKAPMVDKGKARVVMAPSARGKVPGVPEKENSKRTATSSRVASTPAIVINAQPVRKAIKAPATTSSAPSTTATKIIPSVSKSGPPRRVLVDNPTAPPAKARKS
ncbi:hypothetical protein BDN72DRAFT_793676 [Pluteus cervinus]|uniref:Uncharacterized protein n=1 Tax=Pluteus cervinus TaxID=181527 RepID=A0ACD3B1M0_9AGAR|nr:hypothetical protein BDN72DRAFT_793676 [Pluteus cervinus]